MSFNNPRKTSKGLINNNVDKSRKERSNVG